MTTRAITVTEALIKEFGDTGLRIDDALVVAREGGDHDEVQALLARRFQVERAWAAFIRAARLPKKQGELV